MDWLAPVDLYCERFGPSLFAEPFNAASNLAFVAAGLWLLASLPRRFEAGKVPAPFEVLAAMIALIGICSGAFHVFATQWSQALDVGSIGLFIYFFVACFARYALGVRWAFAWLAAPAFWAFGVIVQGPFERGAFNGSVVYFPAWAGIALMAVGLASQRRPGAGLFAMATVLFTASISLRSVDLQWCGQWVWGTHWAWHVLNAGVLSLVILGLVQATNAHGGRPPTHR